MSNTSETPFYCPKGWYTCLSHTYATTKIKIAFKGQHSFIIEMQWKKIRILINLSNVNKKEMKGHRKEYQFLKTGNKIMSNYQPFFILHLLQFKCSLQKSETIHYTEHIFKSKRRM
jgi:hypothetical protein